jgi:Xaa-Pro aminopeptidase
MTTSTITTTATSHVERLREAVATEGLDQILVGDLVTPSETTREANADLFWLCGFSGTSGLAILGAEDALFLTDFRYVERAEREVTGGLERRQVERGLLQEAAKLLHGRVGYDDARTSVRILHKLEEEVGAGVELVPIEDLIAGLRRTKDDEELRRIAEASRLTDEVYAWIIERGLVGRTEREVQLGAEQRMRELGADDPAFPAIVAAGVNGALPHHESSDHGIAPGELVIIDMGAIVDGYCSDCTRTLAAGEPDGEAKAIYELVQGAQAAGLDAVGSGVGGRDADSAARGPIAAAGHGEHFGHGLGHGVGIEIHEAPRLSQRSEDTLAAGDVVSVEPGVYVPGQLGVRIEDLVTITDDGVRNLSSVAKDLIVTD